MEHYNFALSVFFSFFSHTLNHALSSTISIPSLALYFATVTVGTDTLFSYSLF